MNLTEKERAVLTNIVSQPSEFNFDELDFSKTWAEQKLEDQYAFMTFADCRAYGGKLGIPSTRAIFGSLKKKGLIDIMVDDDRKDITWVYINEQKFNQIKELLG